MSNGNMAADVPREPGEVERLGYRAEEHCTTLEQAVDRLQRLSDRIQGSIPRQVDKIERGLATAEVPAGGLAAVHGQIDRMSNISARIFECINRLEEL